MKRDFGIPLEVSGYSGRIHPNFNHDAVIRRLGEGHRLFEAPGCRMLLEGRNRVGVIPLRLPGGIRRDVVVKAFRIQGVDKWKSLIIASKALRAWRSANALKAVEISTPQPIAYFESRIGAFLKDGFFVYVMETEVEEVRFLLRRLGGEDLRKFLEDLARFLGMAHLRGILHRDLSDGNILAGKRGKADWSFFLIDTNRIRILKKVGWIRGVKNLIRLGVPASEQAYFLGRYRQTSRVAWGFRTWYRLNKSAYSGTIALKKKLKLRRLAEKLRIQ